MTLPWTWAVTIQGDVENKRARSELIILIEEQRQALAASCQNFDRGNEWEAARLATCVFTLVHDGGPITSLLTQLGLRAPLRFVSTGRIKNERGLVASTPPLLQINLSSETGVKFRPRFGGFLRFATANARWARR